MENNTQSHSPHVQMESDILYIFKFPEIHNWKILLVELFM